MKTTNHMKAFSFFLLVAYLLSACAGAPAVQATSVGSDKSLAHPVTYVGVIEGIAGDQWTINGVTITVDPTVVRDGPFTVGDQVKVEGTVNQDGSVTVSRVETPSQDDLSTLSPLGNDNDATINDDNSNDALASNDNTNAANMNDDTSINDNGSSANANDDNSNSSISSNSNADDSNGNDDHGNDSGSNSNDDSGDDDSHGDDGNDDNSNG